VRAVPGDHALVVRPLVPRGDDEALVRAAEVVVDRRAHLDALPALVPAALAEEPNGAVGRAEARLELADALVDLAQEPPPLPVPLNVPDPPSEKERSPFTRQTVLSNTLLSSGG
jgi:hypothetical protein